jgi:hypothetical protein
MVERFGPEQVFMDVDTIEPGADFVAAIREACGVPEVGLHLLTWVIGVEGRRTPGAAP